MTVSPTAIALTQQCRAALNPEEAALPPDRAERVLDVPVARWPVAAEADDRHEVVAVDAAVGGREDTASVRFELVRAGHAARYRPPGEHLREYGALVAKVAELSCLVPNRCHRFRLALGGQVLQAGVLSVALVGLRDICTHRETETETRRARARERGRGRGRERGRERHTQADRQAGRQAGSQAGRQPGRQAASQPASQPGRQPGRQPASQAGRQPGRQPARQAGRERREESS